MFKKKSLSIVLAIFILGITGCGGTSDKIPGDAVLNVNGKVFKLSDLNHWLKVYAAQSQAPGQKETPPVPDSPAFTACSAYKQKTAPKPAKGQPKPTLTQLKQQCKQEYGQLRDQVVGQFIDQEWVFGEAKSQGLKASDKDVKKKLAEIKKQQFKTAKEFDDFVKKTGLTTDDINLIIRTNLLKEKLQKKIADDVEKPSKDEISKYYAKNKKQFAQPEKRDLSVVLTKTEAKAKEALKALKSGKDFAKVAKQYSIDPTSKGTGGKLPGVTKGQQEIAFDKAIFSAKIGQLTGPVKTQFGFYVFKVDKTTPASQQTLQQATKQIEQILKSQDQQNALKKFTDKYTKKWKAKTNCRKGYIVENCKNAPKKKKQPAAQPGAPGSSGAPSGATPETPQSGAPQGAPPQQ